jgi:hypothetical protein
VFWTARSIVTTTNPCGDAKKTSAVMYIATVPLLAVVYAAAAPFALLSFVSPFDHRPLTLTSEGRGHAGRGA